MSDGDAERRKSERAMRPARRTSSEHGSVNTAFNHPTPHNLSIAASLGFDAHCCSAAILPPGQLVDDTPRHLAGRPPNRGQLLLDTQKWNAAIPAPTGQG
jgi:hypothetical protein